MNLKLIRIAFRIFKMIKFTITIHAGGILKKALHVGVEPFIIYFCKTFVKSFKIQLEFLL